MNRQEMLISLEGLPEWDIIIIGGGATGLGAAVDAATRGYKTLLLEQYDFSKGTSSRSTKLVHGGVRYLAQGNIKLVKEALRERGYLLKNAPHLTSVQAFVLPVYSWWHKWYYAIGLKIYDLLSGKLSLGNTRILSKKQTIQHIPSIDPDKLKGGVLYYDGQFDDSRLCIDLAVTAAQHGATLVNYCKVIGFEKTKKGKITGVVFTDTLSGQSYTQSAKSVINATGVFADAVMQMDDHTKHDVVSPSQGIHLVVNRSFFPGKDAMIIPKTDDGRVLFAVPWHDRVVLGTTDTPVENIEAEPKPLEEEIEFIISHFNRYGNIPVAREDVKSVFAGLRPLVKSDGPKRTALLARDHTLIVSASTMVTVTGGKWTTYRKMAQDAIDNAVFISKQEKRNCITKDLPIGDPGQRAKSIHNITGEDPSYAQPLHHGFSYSIAEVIHAIRMEMAVTVEDVLARRTRILFLDAYIALEIAPQVADLMQKELGKNEVWKRDELDGFKTLAQQYILS
jgi:glycerol-3-phosphate dehydrogenase